MVSVTTCLESGTFSISLEEKFKDFLENFKSIVYS